MYSSAFPDSEAFFVVQPGVVAWEDPTPVPDGRYLTVSLVSSALPIAADLLRDIVLLRPLAVERFFRVAVVPKPPDTGAAQTRRFTTQFSKDLLGFVETKTSLIDNVGWAVSELRDVSVMDVNSLTDYRHCALLGSSSATSAELLRRARHPAFSDLGGEGLQWLLEELAPVALMRTLDLESHSVIQVLGSSARCDEAIRFFHARGVRQVADVDSVAAEIRQFST